MWNAKKQIFIIIDILYFTTSLKIVILIDSERLIYLINIKIKIYLIKKKKIYKFKLNYTANQHLKLININKNKIIIIDIYKNIKISINLITII